jgi:hypothetical protein
MRSLEGQLKAATPWAGEAERYALVSPFRKTKMAGSPYPARRASSSWVRGFREIGEPKDAKAYAG